MLEKLSPQEFEDWCHILFERLYHCEVESTPYVGDEGRDLIIHRPSEKTIVECKHYPNSTVGRPVVQKLDSAIRKAGAVKGIIITTGRFSKEALQYAQELKFQGIEIDCIDAAKISWLAEKVGLSPTHDSYSEKISLAYRTIPENKFPEALLKSVFSMPRFNPGNKLKTSKLQVTRNTIYEGAYVGEYVSHGELKTSARLFSASWSGLIWITLDGKFRYITSDRNKAIDNLASLGQVLESSPGTSSPPSIQPHEAAKLMKNYVLQACVQIVRYVGGNNVSYRGQVRPNANSTAIQNVRLIYIPRQTFKISIESNEIHRGNVEERDDHFIIQSSTLSACCICGHTMNEKNQVFCAICYKPTHKWTLLTPDSFQCSHCGALVCRNHTRIRGSKRICLGCSTKKEKQLGDRRFLFLWMLFLSLITITMSGIFFLPTKQSASILFFLDLTIMGLATLATLFCFIAIIYMSSGQAFGKKNIQLSYPIVWREITKPRSSSVNTNPPN